MALHDYWAACLERMERYEDALLHARRLIAIDETSHKGYLRLGKLLRLLGDLKGAELCYQMGLKRAKGPGVNEVAQQLRQLCIDRAAKHVPCWDPFAVLPLEVCRRILKYVEVEKVAAMSMCCRLTCELNLQSRGTIIDLKLAKSHLASVKNVIISADKVGRVLDIFDRRQLKDLTVKGGTLNIGMSPSKVTLQRLAIENVTLLVSALETLLCQLEGLVEVVLRGVKFILDRSVDLTVPQWANLKSLTFDQVQGISEQTLADVIGLPACLKTLCWTSENVATFIADKKLSNCVSLEDLCINYAALPHLESSGVSVGKVRSLHLFAGTSQSLVPDHFALLEKFCALQRLRLTNLLFHGQSELNRSKLSLPKLVELHLCSVYPLPPFYHYEMPRLECVTVTQCQFTQISQIPFGPSLRSLVINRPGGEFMSVEVFKRLIESFASGQLEYFGVTGAYAFYESNGAQRLKSIAMMQPCSHLLSDEAVARVVHRCRFI